MQKEIHEQPDSILQTMRGRVQFKRVFDQVQQTLFESILFAYWLSTDIAGLLHEVCMHHHAPTSAAELKCGCGKGTQLHVRLPTVFVLQWEGPLVPETGC